MKGNRTKKEKAPQTASNQGRPQEEVAFELVLMSRRTRQVEDSVTQRSEQIWGSGHARDFLRHPSTPT